MRQEGDKRADFSSLMLEASWRRRSRIRICGRKRGVGCDIIPKVYGEEICGCASFGQTELLVNRTITATEVSGRGKVEENASAIIYERRCTRIAMIEATAIRPSKRLRHEVYRQRPRLTLIL